MIQKQLLTLFQIYFNGKIFKLCGKLEKKANAQINQADEDNITQKKHFEKTSKNIFETSSQ